MLEPEHRGPGGGFWKEVEQQVAAGLILAAVAGVAYIAYTVPRQLDQVLQKQEALTDRTKVIEAQLLTLGTAFDGLDRRVTRLEAGR